MTSTSRRRGGLGRCRHESELLQQPKIVEPAPPFHDLAVGNAEDVDPSKYHVMPSGGFTHRRATVGAVCNEMLDDEISFSDHLLYVASPVGKGAAEERGCLA
jgi:hypothetical protein